MDDALTSVVIVMVFVGGRHWFKYCLVSCRRIRPS